MWPGSLSTAGCGGFAAGELHVTWQSAEGQIGYACAVADRLPATFAALAAGLLHPVHVRIIEDETRVLAPRTARTGRPAMASPIRQGLHHQSHGLRDLAEASRSSLVLDPLACGSALEAQAAG